MGIIITKSKIYGNEKEILTINDKGLFIEKNDGYNRMISEDKNLVEELYSRFFSITYTWRQEYIGPRTIDGEKYVVSMDINHKRKTYKIQNKYPDNWDEFTSFIDGLLENLMK